jgi:hypothetical protein
VITEPPRRPVRRMLETGCYDLLVIGAHLAARRALAHVPIPALVVPASDFAPEGAAADAPVPVQ